MIIDVKGIITGLTNSIFIKEEVEKVATYRLAICNTCEHFSPNIKKKGLQVLRKDKFCADCGCNMHLKVRDLAMQCPLGTKASHYPLETPKWLAEVDDPKLAQQVLDTPIISKEIIDYKIQLSQNKVDEHGS